MFCWVEVPKFFIVSGGADAEKGTDTFDWIVFGERFLRTMKQELYDIAFRKKIYHTLEELQQDADEWIKQYDVIHGPQPLDSFVF